MSEFHVVVTEIGNVSKHPNADTLSITQVLGEYPVIFRTGDFQPGDKAVYVPVDSIVPDGDPRWEFLGPHRRIRAKRLRGIFSMGLLTPADPAWEKGRNVQAELSITKWDPQPLEGKFSPGKGLGGEDERDPGILPVYDLESLRRHPHMLQAGEEVVLTEKIHGCNGRWVWHKDRLWSGSHRKFKKPPAERQSWWGRLLCWIGIRAEKKSPVTAWWRVAEQYKLAEKLAEWPGVAIFGEVYGSVQDLRYGVPAGELRLVVFDAMDVRNHRWFDYDDLAALCTKLDLPMVPLLYRGPWDPALKSYAEGRTTLGADHVREGFVVRPVKERRHDHNGRVCLKFVGEGYLLRKE